MRVKHSAIILVAGFILMPTLLWSQPGNFGPPGGGGSGRSNSDRASAFFAQMDPDQLFNMMSKGQDVIRVEGMDPVSRSMFDRFASVRDYGTRHLTVPAFAKIAGGRVQPAALTMTRQNDGPGGDDRIFDDRFNQLDRNPTGCRPTTS